MKKLALFLIIMMLLSIGVYAEDNTNIQKLIGKSDTIEYVAHANNKTYVIYKSSKYYLGTIDNGKINSIGEIDKLIGGNKEPKGFMIAGSFIQDKDYNFVSGMTQLNGEIYVSKKRHIYKLSGNKLVEIPLTYNNKRINMEAYDCTIGKFTSNSTDMYIALRLKGHFLTGDGYLDSVVDRMVFKVNTKGEMEPTWLQLWDQGVHPNWNSLENILCNMSVSDNGKIAYMAGTYENPVSIYNMEEEISMEVQSTGIGMPENSGIHNDILLYDTYMIGYTARIRNYGPYSIVIKGINLTEPDEESGYYTSTEVAEIEIPGMYYINHWTKGDDGNIYIVTQDLKHNTSVYVLKM